MRRRILRHLHTDFSHRSVDDLAGTLRLGASQIRYHGEILAGWEIVKEIEGPNGYLIESLVAEDPEVVALLSATQAEDEAA